MIFIFPTDQYMAFGISGTSDTRTEMVGADVMVTQINDDELNAIDYYLTNRQQVRLLCKVYFCLLVFTVLRWSWSVS